MIVRTVAPEGLPRPTGDEGHRMLDMIWGHFAEHRSWPTYGDIDRRLYAAGLEWEEVVTQLCPALLGGPSVLRIPPQDTQELELTIAGAANCAGTDAVISVFLAMVRTAATIEPHFRPNINVPQPVLVKADMMREDIDPNLLSDKVLYAAAAMWRHEPCFRGSSINRSDMTWFLHYHRGIRPFADVQGLEDYWERRERVLGPERAAADRRPYVGRPEDLLRPAVPAALLSSRPGQETPEMMEITCILHPLIAEVAAERFRDGHYLDAVVHAFKAVEHRVQTLSGFPQVGTSLMGNALGTATPAITVTRSTGTNLKGEQEGMMYLFRGAMAALRNPRAHGPNSMDECDEAQEMLAFASFLMRRLDINDETRTADGSEL